MKDISFLTKSYIAHRGLHNKIYPENSLGAFKNAIKKGYSIECDIHVTKDKKVVVFHDNNLKRMTVMLYSLFMQETGEVNVYIPSVKADDETLRYLSMYVENWQGKRLIPVYTDTNIWSMSEDNSYLSIEIIYTLFPIE